MGMVQGMASRCLGAPERWGWRRESNNTRCSGGTGTCVALWEKSQLGEGLAIAKFPLNPQSLGQRAGVTWEGLMGRFGQSRGRKGAAPPAHTSPAASKGNVPEDAWLTERTLH